MAEKYISSFVNESGNDRGFKHVKFTDVYGDPVTISERSTDPLGSQIMLVIDEPTVFGHNLGKIFTKEEVFKVGIGKIMASIDINKDIATDLIKVLQHFIETGEASAVGIHCKPAEGATIKPIATELDVDNTTAEIVSTSEVPSPAEVVRAVDMIIETGAQPDHYFRASKPDIVFDEEPSEIIETGASTISTEDTGIEDEESVVYALMHRFPDYKNRSLISDKYHRQLKYSLDALMEHFKSDDVEFKELFIRHTETVTSMLKERKPMVDTYGFGIINTREKYYAAMKAIWAAEHPDLHPNLAPTPLY